MLEGNFWTRNFQVRFDFLNEIFNLFLGDYFLANVSLGTPREFEFFHGVLIKSYGIKEF